MSNRRFALALWASVVLFTGTWWGLSYRYGIGFAVTGPTVGRSTRPPAIFRSGVALVSGVGKGVFYLSWSSAFTRQGFIFEPVLAHEFPHPWLGFQNEGGRLWFSFPIGAVFGIALAGAAWSLDLRRRRGNTEVAPPDDDP